jgi:cytochrome c biogenesis protein CcdA/thioredoxin-related protein
MKKITLVFIALILFAVHSSAQIAVKVTARKISDKNFDLSFQFESTNEVWIYADNKLQQIEGPKVELINAAASIAKVTGAGQAVEDPIFENNRLWVFSSFSPLSSKIQFTKTYPARLKGKILGYYREGDQFLSFELPFETDLAGGESQLLVNQSLVGLDLSRPLNDCGKRAAVEDRSALGVFLLGLAGGLLALLTPCVFPMIPVTVSFFTNRATSRKDGIKNGMLYGGFIFLIYIAASIPFHLVKGLKPELLNNIATSAPLNIFFFFIFLFFALSFFGVFTISLPSSLATGASKKTGIFFMSLTLVIVSFSCTGPIIGSLLVGTLSGGAWLLTAGLAGFGVALALPFGLFAVFPQWLKKLPKSGGWLETFKKSLAFIELALAFKFLSNADLVMHWGILKREVFIMIWILLSFALSFYLLNIPGLIKHHKWMIGKWRAGLAAGVFLFGLYLIPAIHPDGHPALSFLSGFPPPAHYSVYKQPGNHLKDLKPIMNDYQLALKKSKEENKPILIDFTGWACVNCRKMEEQVWVRPEVAEVIRDKYILLSLYVDDKELLPVEERTESLQTVGDKWAKFQSENFKQVTQPLYVAISPDEKLLTHPVGYTPDAQQYLEWLRCGVGE